MSYCRKFNVFMYGCENRKHSEKYLREQIFPLMLHKNSAEKFSFDDCEYNGSILYSCISLYNLLRVRHQNSQAVSTSNAIRSRRGGSSSGQWGSCAATRWRRPTAAPTWAHAHSHTSTRRTTRASDDTSARHCSTIRFDNKLDYI